MANNKFRGVYKDKYNFFTGFGEDYTFENKTKILANYYIRIFQNLDLISNMVNSG